MAVFTINFITNLPKMPIIFHVLDDTNKKEDDQIVANANAARDNEMNSNVIQL